MSVDTLLDAKQDREVFLCRFFENYREYQLERPDVFFVPEIDPEEFPSRYHMSEEESLKRAGRIAANSWYAASEIGDMLYLLSSLKAYHALMRNIHDPEAKELVGKCLDFSQEQADALAAHAERFSW